MTGLLESHQVILHLGVLGERRLVESRSQVWFLFQHSVINVLSVSPLVVDFPCLNTSVDLLKFIVQRSFRDALEWQRDQLGILFKFQAFRRRLLEVLTCNLICVAKIVSLPCRLDPRSPVVLALEFVLHHRVPLLSSKLG